MAGDLDAEFDALPEAPPPIGSRPGAVSDLNAEFDALPEMPSPAIAPSVTGFTAEDLDTQKAEAKSARYQRLKVAFDAAQQVGDRAARAMKVKDALGIKYSEALDNLEGFETASRVAQFDPERFEHDNPMLAKLLDRRPELADLVFSDKEIAVSSRAWTQAEAWNQRPVKESSPAEIRAATEDLAQQADERNQTNYASTPAAPVVDSLEAERNRPHQPSPEPEAPPQTPEQLAAAQKEFDTKLAKKLAPEKVQELDDAKAKVGREFGFPLVQVLRTKEALAQADVAKAQISWMLAEVQKGEDSPEALDARGRLDDLKMEATPRAYGDDEGLSRQLTIGIQGGLSTFEMLEGSVKGAGLAGAAAGTITGLGALAVAPVKSPAVFLRGFVAGAEYLAPKGAQLGAAWASFNMELGPTYENNRQLVTDDGQRLTAKEAFGAAVLESGLKAGLESLSFGVQAKGLAGGVGAIRDRLRGQLSTDPTLRKKLAELGVEWLKGGASEAGTGGLQSLVEQIGDYLAKTAKDTKASDLLPGGEGVAWQKGPVVDVRRTLTDAEHEGVGGLLFGAVAGPVSLAMTQTAAARDEHLNQQVPSLLAMAQSETFQTAPQVFAETVREKTAESGAEVTALHVDGDAVLKFFQENEPDDPTGQKTLTELLGPDAPAKATAAGAGGTKLEIPLERAPAWAASDIGKALVANTTLDPESLSPQQAAERAPEIKAEGKRIADAAQADAKEVAEIDAALPDVEKELVATGRSTKAEARDVATIWKAFSTTMSRSFGMSATALFKQLQVRFFRGEDEQLALGLDGEKAATIEQTDAPDDLVQFEQNLTDERRRELMYLDVDPTQDPRGKVEPISGLHSRRAWDARVPTPGTQVGLISVPDVKAINDNEKGSHDVTNRLLRLFGAKLGAVTEGRQSARSGTDFLVEVTDQAQLDGIVKELQAVAPQGIRVFGFAAPTLKAANAAEKGGTQKLRDLPEGDPNRLLPRGKTAFALETLTDESFPAEPAARTVPEHLQQKAPSKGDAFIRDVLMSHIMPGARSRAGFYAAGARKHSASLDLRGLKNINIMMRELLMAAGRSEEDAIAEGNKTGDELMRQVGLAAQKAGGADVIFSHMSGDELAAKHHDKARLELFVEEFAHELQLLRVPVILDGKRIGSLVPKFRHGIAEGSYGKADQALNRDKAREPKLPELSAAGELRRAGILVDESPGPEGAPDSGPGGSPPGNGGAPGEAGGVQAATRGAPSEGAEGSAAGDASAGVVGGGAEAGNEGLPLGGREVRAPGDGGVDGADDGELERVIADTLAEREERGPLRSEEAVALEAHYNLPENVEKARASVGRFRQATVKAVAGETKKKHKARVAEAKKELAERRAAAEAFIDWVENTGKGIEDKALAYSTREGALRVSAELLKETLDWAHKHKLLDPENGFSALMERENRRMNPQDPSMRRGKYHSPRNAYDRAKQQERADQLNKNLGRDKGYFTLNQSDPSSRDTVTAALEDELLTKVEDRPKLREEVAAELKKAREAVDDAFRAWNQHKLGYEFGWMAVASARARDHALRAVFHEISARQLAETGKTGVISKEGDILDQAPAWGPLVRDIDNRMKGVSRSALLFQPDDKKSTPRGYVMLPPAGALEKVYRVFLNKRADASTAMHESAHVFLLMMLELGVRPDAPSRLKEQQEATLKWLGLADRAELILMQPARGQELTAEQEAHNKRARDAHEKWARGFEAYLFEGKAPTDALNKVFTRFKLWLMKIYRSIASLKVELNDDIRKVFDRLLATDDELQRERAEHGPALFNTAEEAGMTPEDFAEYQDDLQQAEEHAKRKAELHVMRERLVETEAWWARELADVTKKAGEDYERLPARRAQRIIGGVRIGDFDAEPVVFDRAATEAIVGKAQAKKLNTTDEGGTHPDEVAEFAGYETGGAMLAAVLTLPTKETWVKREAEARMKEAHPSVLDERAKLQKMVAEGLHKVTEKRLLEERAALRSRGPKGSTSPAPIEALKEAARLMVERTPLGQIQPHLALNAERRAANDAVRFAVRGDTAAALEANTRQLLNAAVYREAMKAADARDALFELAKDLSGQKARARAGKASPAFRDAIDFILETLNLKKQQLEQLTPESWAKGLQAINDAVALMEEEEVDVGAWHESIGELLGKRDWRKLTVKEGRTLRESLENLRAGAIVKNTVLIDGKRVERELVVADLVREIRAKRAKQRTPGTGSSDVIPDVLNKAWNQFDSFLSNPQDTFRELSGDDPESMLNKALVMTMQRAKHREADLLKSTIKDVLDAFEAMPKKMLARADDKVEGAKMFALHTDRFLPPRRRHEIWMMALNYGNEGNAQRLRDGRNISHSEVVAALDMLTKEEIDVLQTILDAHEKLKPEAFDLEEADSGLRPQEVKARPLKLKNGTLKGGYFPIAYEAVSQLGKVQEGNLAAGVLDKTYGRGATPRGHLKQRAAEVHDNIITLDPRRLFANYAQVAHDLAFRQAVRSVNSLLKDEHVVSALQERVGVERTREAQQWVKDIAQMRAAEVTDTWSKVNRFLRGNMAPALLGYYLPNAIGDLANLPAAVASTPLQSKHLAAGLAEYGSSPIESRKAALEKSGELRFMQDQLTRDFQKQVKDLSRGELGRGIAKVKDKAFIFMEAVNVATATPVWIGAYRQALAEGKTEQQARDFGDDILRRVFPSHSVVDQAAILRDKGFWGTVTVFYGYLSVAARATRTLANPLFTQAFQDASKGEKAWTAAKVGMAMGGFFFAYQVLGEFLMGRGPEDGDRDEDDPENKKLKWARWMKRKMIMAPVSLAPVPGLSTGVEAGLLKKKANPKADPLGSFIQLVLQAFFERNDVERSETAKRVGKIGALGTGMPIRQLETTGGYLNAREPQGPLRTAGGLVYGQREGSPENVFTVLADLFGEN